MIILIPARRGSKGFPFKNRILFRDTVDKIPQNMRKNIRVYTDDEEIVAMSKGQNLVCVQRPPAPDEQTTKQMVMSFVKKECKHPEDILMLYLTYPERTWESVEEAMETYASEGVRSLLSKKSPDTHPYLCMYEIEGNRGTQVIEHDLCRRQDYPNCFEISHQVCIFNSTEVDKLNNNLYNENTYFFLVNSVPDIDYAKDYEGVVRHD